MTTVKIERVNSWVTYNPDRISKEEYTVALHSVVEIYKSNNKLLDLMCSGLGSTVSTIEAFGPFLPLTAESGERALSNILSYLSLEFAKIIKEMFPVTFYGCLKPRDVLQKLLTILTIRKTLKSDFKAGIIPILERIAEDVTSKIAIDARGKSLYFGYSDTGMMSLGKTTTGEYKVFEDNAYSKWDIPMVQMSLKNYLERLNTYIRYKDIALIDTLALTHTAAEYEAMTNYVLLALLTKTDSYWTLDTSLAILAHAKVRNTEDVTEVIGLHNLIRIVYENKDIDPEGYTVFVDKIFSMISELGNVSLGLKESDTDLQVLVVSKNYLAYTKKIKKDENIMSFVSDTARRGARKCFTIEDRNVE
jgi:hypothetical protein